jgi:hypothetical protein
MVSRVDPPVVSTSSTTSTRSLGAPVQPLGKDRTYAEGPSDLLSNHDAAERRRQDDGRVQSSRAIGKGPAE